MSFEDLSPQPPTSQTNHGVTDNLTTEEASWLRIARASFHSSTNYVDQNLRKGWEDGIRAFNSMHTSESKYLQPSYEKRSRLFRPKTRSVMRKNEAAAAAAYFSSMDATSVEPMDQNDKFQSAGAELMKQILEYRLSISIKWFSTVLGGLQDAQSTGVVLAHIYWEYKPAIDIEVLEEEKIELSLDEDEEWPDQPNLPKGARSIEDNGDHLSIAAMKPLDPLAILGNNRTELPPALGLSAPPSGLASSQAVTPLQPPENALQAPSGAAQGPSPAQMVGTPPALQGQPLFNEQQSPTSVSKKSMKPRARVDRPCIDLLPAENLRIDPCADWTDPIHSSPFIIHLIPMYYMDVKARMETGEWKRYGEGYIKASCDNRFDSTRITRQNREDPYTSTNKSAADYEICWVQRHIHRRDDVDWEFYTLGDFALLTTPRLLSETVLHGMRPYEMGCCILETHKCYPSSLAYLGKDLQAEANEISNQRLDNVKFVLNKKYLVKRGEGQDLVGLVRNVPGGVVMVNDPVNDVRELTWQDVTQSSYEEQGRIDNDMADLLGNFSAGQVMADHGINGPARNMAMLSQNNGTLVEYLLRTYTETFVQPVLRQLIKMEQAYETDEILMAVAGKKAELMQKYGIDVVTDDLLDQSVTLRVNVGMGATDPQMKLQKFITGVETFAKITQTPPMGLNLEEVGKEIFAHLGYRDGSRFFTNDNPQVAMLQAQLDQAKKEIQKVTQALKEKTSGIDAKVKTAQLAAETKEKISSRHEDAENMRTAVAHKMTLVDNEKNRTHDVNMKNLENAHTRQMGSAGHSNTLQQMSMSQGAKDNEPE